MNSETPRARLTTPGMKRLRRIYKEDWPWPEVSFADWLRSETLGTFFDISPEDEAFLAAVREAAPASRRVRNGH